MTAPFFALILFDPSLVPAKTFIWGKHAAATPVRVIPFIKFRREFVSKTTNLVLLENLLREVIQVTFPHVEIVNARFNMPNMGHIVLFQVTVNSLAEVD